MSLLDLRAREHGAWMDFCRELRQVLGGFSPVPDLEDDSNRAMLNAVRKWGEELAQLRIDQYIGDGLEVGMGRGADTVERALESARAVYEGQYERGTYPQDGAGG